MWNKEESETWHLSDRATCKTIFEHDEADRFHSQMTVKRTLTDRCKKLPVGPTIFPQKNRVAVNHIGGLVAFKRSSGKTYRGGLVTHVLRYTDSMFDRSRKNQKVRVPEYTFSLLPLNLVQFGFCTNLVQFRFSSLNKLVERTAYWNPMPKNFWAA